jgi:hypothetical protein
VQANPRGAGLVRHRMMKVLVRSVYREIECVVFEKHRVERKKTI